MSVRTAPTATSMAPMTSSSALPGATMGNTFWSREMATSRRQGPSAASMRASAPSTSSGLSTRSACQPYASASFTKSGFASSSVDE